MPSAARSRLWFVPLLICLFVVPLALLSDRAVLMSNAKLSGTTSTTVSAAASTNTIDFLLHRDTSTELAWWLDSSAAGTLFSDSGCTTASAVGGAVRCWKDPRPGKSKATTTGTAATRASLTINGLYPVVFSTCAALTGPDLLGGSTSNFMIFAVIRERARVSNFLVSLNGTASDLDRVTMHMPWQDGAWYFDPNLTGGPGPRVISTANITAVGAATQITAWIDSTVPNSYLTVNGQQFTGTNSQTVGTTGGLRLGCTLSYTPNHDIAELLVFKTTLSSADRATLSQYLKQKWATP